jgi:hypothetical protein
VTSWEDENSVSVAAQTGQSTLRSAVGAGRTVRCQRRLDSLRYVRLSAQGGQSAVGADWTVYATFGQSTLRSAVGADWTVYATFGSWRREDSPLSAQTGQSTLRSDSLRYVRLSAQTGQSTLRLDSLRYVRLYLSLGHHKDRRGERIRLAFAVLPDLGTYHRLKLLWI